MVTKAASRTASTKASAKKTASKKSSSTKSASTSDNSIYTDPELRERLKAEILAGDRGGKPHQWSARKAQLLAQEYERAGGGYKRRARKGAPQKSLSKWTAEEWQTASGDTRARRDDGTVERYLPKKAWNELSPAQKAATTRKKQAASKKGTQFVSNTAAAKQARRRATKKAKSKKAKSKKAKSKKAK